MAVGCCLAGSAQAQLFGIEGGVTFNTLKMELDDEDFDHGYRTGFKLGGFIDAPIGRGASFQPGLYYITKGSEFETKNTYSTGGTTIRETMDQKIQINYLEIPLNFQFKLNPMRRSGLFFGAGPYVAFAMGGDVDTKYTLKDLNTGISTTDRDSYDLELGDDPDEDDIRKTDWGINLNIGYVGVGGLFMRGNAGIGLSNIIPGQDDDFSAKNLSFGLSLGYVFGR